MLIRLMKLASEQDESAQTLDIFDRANKDLTVLAEFGPAGRVRRDILDLCVEDIREMNGSVAGSTSVILAFLSKDDGSFIGCEDYDMEDAYMPTGRRPRNARADSPTASEDVEHLVEKFDIATLVVNELVEFVERHRSMNTNPRMRNLKLRLELLSSLLSVSPRCLSKELHARLWEYLVGEKALGSSERDMGYGFYFHFGVTEVVLPASVDSNRRSNARLFRALIPYWIVCTANSFRR